MKIAAEGVRLAEAVLLMAVVRRDQEISEEPLSFRHPVWETSRQVRKQHRSPVIPADQSRLDNLTAALSNQREQKTRDPNLRKLEDPTANNPVRPGIRIQPRRGRIRIQRLRDRMTTQHLQGRMIIRFRRGRTTMQLLRGQMII